MPKTIEKKEIIAVPEGICKRIETKISEDGKSVELTMFYEVKTQDELIAEAEAKAKKEAEEKARKEKEEGERKEAEEKLKKEEEEKANEQKEESEDNAIEEANQIEPTIDDYMAALKKTEEALKALKNEESKFKERMQREAIPPQDLPDFWQRYSDACHEEYLLSEKVVYCGKKALLWSQWGFKNIRKKWTLKEDWFQDVTSKDLLTRTITWEGTLEEYCQNYNLYIHSSMYTCDLQRFCGSAFQNTPKGVSAWDHVEVNILV